jgi:hypothetical protein
MEPWLIGKALSPFAAVLVVWLVTAPCRRFIQRRMKDGPLKDLFLRRIS